MDLIEGEGGKGTGGGCGHRRRALNSYKHYAEVAIAAPFRNCQRQNREVKKCTGNVDLDFKYGFQIRVSISYGLLDSMRYNILMLYFVDI